MTQAENFAKVSHQPSAISNNSVLVSIIIPAYNTAPYIHRAIQSSLSQTNTNTEILIIDDGSTDDTLRVARSFAEKDSRIRVYHQENAGVSAARNHGIREASGEYLLFLDSDDWLEPDALETLLDAQMKYPDRVICANRYWGVKVENGVLIRPCLSKNKPSELMSINDIAESYCLFQGAAANFHNLHAKLFLASLAGTFPEGLKWGEDAVFFIEYLLKSNGAYYIDQPLVNVLGREGSATRSHYRPDYTDSLVGEHIMIDDLVKGDKEIRILMQMSRNMYIWNECLKKAADENVSNSEIRRIQKILRASAPCTLKCRKYSLQMRMRFFLDVYLPPVFVKALRLVYRCLNAVRKRNSNMEIVENWKDFPSQP